MNNYIIYVGTKFLPTDGGEFMNIDNVDKLWKATQTVKSIRDCINNLLYMDSEGEYDYLKVYSLGLEDAFEKLVDIYAEESRSL